jgi:hypothetical protein
MYFHVREVLKNHNAHAHDRGEYLHRDCAPATNLGTKSSTDGTNTTPAALLGTPAALPKGATGARTRCDASTKKWSTTSSLNWLFETLRVQGANTPSQPSDAGATLKDSKAASAIPRKPTSGLFVYTLIAVAIAVSLLTTPAASQPEAKRSDARPVSDASGDGQHDFDFNFGVWRTHVSRLLNPLTAPGKWAEYDGTSIVTPIWGARAGLFELEVEGAAGHIEGAGLRLYNPQSRQWSLHWTSSRNGEPQPTMYGQFVAGRGEFFDHEVVDGKNVLVRNTFSDIKPDFSRFEQAFSADGGRTWEVNWIMTFTRVAHDTADPARAATADEPAAQAGQHDFDFAFGTWKTHIRRLTSPLSGTNDWVEYDGTHTIRKVWNGRANLGELEAEGPAGHIEALSPRYFDPQNHLWRVSYGNPRDGTLSSPLVGEFKNGRGEFYGEDTYKGRAILVREIYSPVDATTRKLEVAYSADGGRSWETNWIMTDTHMSSPR